MGNVTNVVFCLQVLTRSSSTPEKTCRRCASWTHDPRRRTARYARPWACGYRTTPVTQALLARLDRPLLCGTVPNLDETYDDDNQDPVLMLDEYERKGLAFLVDVGVMHNPASTVIDLSSGSPKLIRRGAGDASMWVDEDEDPTLASDDEAWGF